MSAGTVNDRVKQLEDELALAKAQIVHMSRVDDLTGVANRRVFDEILATEFLRASRAGSRLALVLCDIDFFKPFQDVYGLSAGDRCLKLVAGAVDAMARRAGELAARRGGEAFALVLPGLGREDARHRAEGLRARVQDLAIPHGALEVSEHVTLSVGVATIEDAAADTPEAFVAKAEAALVRARQGGGDRVEMSRPDR